MTIFATQKEYQVQQMFIFAFLVDAGSAVSKPVSCEEARQEPVTELVETSFLILARS